MIIQNKQKTLHIINIAGKFLYQKSTLSHELEKEWKNPNMTVNIMFLTWKYFKVGLSIV